MSALLFSTTCAYANYGIALYGIERSSGNTVLAIATVSEGQLSVGTAEQQTYDPLPHTIISRGVLDVWQGASGSLLYRRVNAFWRYSAGDHRKLNDIDELDVVASTADTGFYEAPGREDQKEPLLASAHPETALTARRNPIRTLLSGNAFLPQRPSEYDVQPLGWLDSKRLLLLEARYDGLERLQESKLYLARVDKPDVEEEVAQQPLLGLPARTLEVVAAPTQGKVAFQTFDEQTKEFQLGIRDVDAQIGAFRWLPLPSHPTRGTIFYKKSFADHRAVSLSWSPSGRYLVVKRKSDYLVWDDKTRLWLQKDGNISFANTSSYVSLLWLDDDIVVTVQRGIQSLEVRRISQPHHPFLAIGTIKGIEVREMFLVALPRASNSKTATDDVLPRK